MYILQEHERRYIISRFERHGYLNDSPERVEGRNNMGPVIVYCNHDQQLTNAQRASLAPAHTHGFIKHMIKCNNSWRLDNAIEHAGRNAANIIQSQINVWKNRVGGSGIKFQTKKNKNVV